MIIEAILAGLGLGLALAVLIGPVFFALLQESIARGFNAGMAMAAGVSTGDALYIAVIFLAVDLLPTGPGFQVGLSIGGGLLLVGMGLASWFKRPQLPNLEAPTGLSAMENGRLFLRGLALNSLSPFVLLFWLATVGKVRTSYGFNTHEQALCFVVTVLTVFGTDLLKAFSARQLARYLTAQRLLWLNRLVGLGLIAFGCRLFWYGWRNF